MRAESLPQTDPPGKTLFACDECWKASLGSAGAGAVDASACHRNGGGLDLSAACAEAPAGKHATVFPSTHERSPDHPVHQALPAPSVSLWWQRVAKPLLPHAMNESAWLVVSGVRRAPVEGTEKPRPHPRLPPSNADTAQSSEFLKDVDGPRHARARRLHCPRLGGGDRPRRGRPAGGAHQRPAHHRPASAAVLVAAPALRTSAVAVGISHFREQALGSCFTRRYAGVGQRPGALEPVRCTLRRGRRPRATTRERRGLRVGRAVVGRLRRTIGPGPLHVLDGAAARRTRLARRAVGVVGRQRVA